MADLELRPLGTTDAAAVLDLFRRWERYWKVPEISSLATVEEELTDPHFTPELDSRGVWSGDRLVAFGSVGHIPSGERQEKAVIGGRVDPEMRGLGIGRRLLAWQIERGVERLRECDPSIPWFIRAYEWDWISDAHHLFSRFGLVPVRWFEDMVRPLSEPLDVATPEAVEIVGWEEVPTEETRRVSNASFADHWGSTPRDAEAWTHMLKGEGSRPDLSLVAVAEGQVIGVCLNFHYPQDEEVTGRIDGWIAHLGVVREWRRRGVAAALIARSLESFREAGMTHAMLGVDADNPTGASGLYRRLGFETLHRTVTSEIQIRSRAD
ncbi:MAG TPA: GNAT family N-acetyltransferase [Acidimicrobiia bacterium]|nr:GNAT family N-acetyltransferase [Acidimicrobiia bacterium]